jgi:two-component system CheB/CheR fusion protein
MNAPQGRAFDRTYIVGLGASAGGLEALRELLEEARPQDGVAYVVVQHLDPNHESLMAEILRRHTPLGVTQVSGGEAVDGGQVYIIPPGAALSIEDGRLRLENFDAPRGLRRPIDTFFRSLSIDQCENAICVVLSGTGADGALGLKFVKENGGLCIAQEPGTAKYDGMPAAAIATGIVDFVLPPGEIAPAIVGFLRRQRGLGSAYRESDEQREQVLRYLRATTGHDFTRYRETTLGRRLDRRLQVLGLNDLGEYLDLLREDRDEPQRLMSELLINVTRFFRDAEAFETLRRDAIAPLIERTPEGEEIRVWVAACSSGEEAYSIAMLLDSERRAQGRNVDFHVFATDIDERVLDVARAGLYAPPAIEDVPEDLRRAYFVPADSHFRVIGSLRETVRFTAHNLIRDPPFARLDLLSCRNLMIYLREDLQAEVWPIFHYALRPGGFLFLGSAEALGGHDDMFATLDAKSRLFQRREGRARVPVRMPARGAAEDRPLRLPTRAPARRGDSAPEAHIARLLDQFAPPSVVVDADGEILHATGRLARFLDIPPEARGPHYLADVARPGLREAITQLQRTAQRDKRRMVARDLQVRSEFGAQATNVFADPLSAGRMLIVFAAAAPMQAAPFEDAAELDPVENPQQVLEEELRESRYKLRTTTEELETANEELKASNEEMMSMNEELQSTNEELSTVNDELKLKIDQLVEANSNLANFFSSTALAVVMLDRALKVRSYSDAATQLFGRLERGLPLDAVEPRLSDVSFLAQAREVLDSGASLANLLMAGERVWSLFMSPYKSAQGQIGGVTLVFTDVTERQRAEAQLARERGRAQLAMKIAGLGAWEYEIESGATTLDDEVIRMFGLDDHAARSIDGVLARIDAADRPKVETQLRRAISGEAPYEATFRVHLPDGRQRVVKGLGALVEGARPRKLVGVNFDVTSEQEAATLREMVIREMNHRIKNMFAVIVSILRGAGRGAHSKQELVEVVTNRILALSNAHSLVLRADKAGAALRVLVTTALEPFARGAPFTIRGPDLVAPSDSVTSLALILHEWATNAAKYGVLGPIPGALDVSWERLDSGGARLSWVERYNQPTPVPPTQSGFGSRLVTLSATTINAQLHQERDERHFAMTLEFAVEE